MGEDPTTRLKRNTLSHDIDLCPLYGRTAEQTLALRLRTDAPGFKGRLKTPLIDGGDYAPYLYKDGVGDPQFAVLDSPLGDSKLDPARRDTLLAFGSDRANSVPQVSMLNKLFCANITGWRG